MRSSSAASLTWCVMSVIFGLVYPTVMLRVPGSRSRRRPTAVSSTVDGRAVGSTRRSDLHQAPVLPGTAVGDGPTTTAWPRVSNLGPNSPESVQDRAGADRGAARARGPLQPRPERARTSRSMRSPRRSRESTPAHLGGLRKPAGRSRIAAVSPGDGQEPDRPEHRRTVPRPLRRAGRERPSTQPCT